MISGVVDNVPYAFGTVGLPPEWEFPESGLAVQLVQPESVYGPRHVVSSVHQTLKAFAQNTNISPDKGIELLLRLAGTRQVKDAMKLKPEATAVLVVVGEGASEEYSRLSAGWEQLDDPVSRPEELDAVERSLLL